MLHLILSLVRTADRQGERISIPPSTPFVWSKGLELQAIDPVALCIPSTGASKSEHANPQFVTTRGTASIGKTGDQDGPTTTHNIFMEPAVAVRATQEVRLFLETPDQKPARFIVLRDAEFDY